jgi:hypothetical protein
LEGALGTDAHVAACCEDLLVLESALWTFIATEEVEPTNNLQRALDASRGAEAEAQLQLQPRNGLPLRRTESDGGATLPSASSEHAGLPL